MKPQSFVLSKMLRVSVRASFTENANGYNVLGFIPGSDPFSKKVVIIGAHYDHLEKDVDGNIFRGANDDASGVAVMMEIARVLSTASRPKCSALFAAWSGEEEGTRGSYAYANRPFFPLSETIAYLNLDMVGYGQQLVCQISEAHKTLRTTLDESAVQLGVSISVEKFSGGSDHVHFERNKVANLMFIRWPDEFYHTPRDMDDRIPRKNLLETARLTALIAMRLIEVEATVETVTATVRVTSSSRTGIVTSGQFLTDVFSVNVLAIAGVVFIATVAAGVFCIRRPNIFHRRVVAAS
ncbi:M28 family peptidase [Candidatus Bathyarchaeota archaeon]|nr:M28 family peptidase [Candidatus Bathyarchaeota archaeon]